MTVAEIKKVCFVGAGTMGCYNSIVAAISGYEVVLYDIDAACLHEAPLRQAEFAAFLVSSGYCQQDTADAALAAITRESDLCRALLGADLVSESIVERLDIKQQLHRQLDELSPAETILTTNSSALPVSAIAAAVTRGERFAALHSHLGAPLVDIVGGPRTSAVTIDILKRYVISLGGVPLVLKKEHPGYVLNAMLGPLLSTAMSLVGEGEIDYTRVDMAWMHHRRAPMGPFGMMDLFGLNLVYDSWRYREEDAENAGLRTTILALLGPLVDAGKLGMKAGQGFYGYPGPRYQQSDFLVETPALLPLYQALITALIGNAIVLATLEVAEPGDIDMAWKVGTYLDAGPFEMLADIGTVAFLSMLAEQLAAGRFAVSRARMIEQYLERSALESSQCD